MLTASLLRIASKCATVPVENSMITIKHNRWTACEFDSFVSFGEETIFDIDGSKELWTPHMRYYPSDWFFRETIEEWGD